MKNIVLLSILLVAAFPVLAQTPCGNLANLPGKWVQDTPAGKDPKAVNNVKAAMSLFQRSVSGFTGGQAKTYLFTSGWVDTRPYKYQSFTAAMYFLQFECVHGKIKPEAATGTWLYIGFNEIPFFTGNNDAGEYFRLPNGQQMFFSQYKLQGNFKGLTQIVPIHHTDSTAVFLSKSNRLPLRSVSQADVLVGYKKFYTQQRTVAIKWQENILAKDPANIRSREIIAENKKEIADCISTIDKYLSKPVAKQPAVVEGIDYYCNPEKMFNPKSSPKQIMVFDADYFDKTLPPASPQFIVVYWRKEDANKVSRDGSFRFPLKREFIRKFEENFDFEALNKMLGK